MFQKLKKNAKGFTIIEVLIVLAIAGLIMLIVFLAVPALQRNSRNNARNNDAARISSAITECMSNRNNDVTSCDAPTDLQPGTLSQLATVQFYGIYVVVGGTTDTARYAFGFGCNAEGSAPVGGAGPKNHAVVFEIEGSSGTIDRCIAG